MMKTLLQILCLLLFWMASLPLSAQMSRADKDYELGAFNLAVRNYLQVLEKRPANYEAMVRLADSYRYLNEMDEAKSWYEKAIRNNKLEGEQMFNYALVLKALGQYDKAQQWFLAYARSNRDQANKGNHFAQTCQFAANQMGQSSPYLISNEYINTTASEFGPAFYGDQVVFSSGRADLQPPGATWTGRSQNQLYMARVGNNKFLESPVLLQRNDGEGFVNTGPVSFAPELKEVFYTKNNFIDGTRHIPTGGLELSLASSSINPNREWTNEQAFPFNGSGYSTGWPHLSPDGNTLYFASNRPDGFGGFDLYVSYRMGNTWSTPENLGPNVNTPGDEVSPFYDGNFLFFSSNWHPGLGGYDIFRAEQSDGRWTRIFHLGNLINSSRDDLGFIYHSFNNRGYMVSNRPGGKGHYDIYKVFKSADNIQLNVQSASDGAPIPYATIDFINCGEGLHKADSRGNYSFQAVEGLDCNIRVRADGYREAIFQVSTMGARQNREVNVKLVREGEDYTGKILDYQSRRPLSGVAVSSTNLASGSTMETTTDQFGDYTLSFSPNSTYSIRYSRPGYRDINRTVNTEEGFNRDELLGVINMLPVNAPGNVAPPPNPSPGIRSVDEEVRPRVGGGYAVQVAALSKPGLESFSELGSIGRVYSKVEDGKYKVRVGVFPTRPAAEQAMARIRDMGYPKPFIVKEEGENQMTPKGGSSPQSYNSVQPLQPAAAVYKVKLGDYRDTRWFDSSAVRGLGRVEEMRRSDGLTTMLLSGFRDLTDARDALRRVRTAGFTQAQLLQDMNGVMQIVE